MVRTTQIKICTKTHCSMARAQPSFQSRCRSHPRVKQITELGCSLNPLLVVNSNKYCAYAPAVCGFACSRSPSVDGGVIS